MPKVLITAATPPELKTVKSEIKKLRFNKLDFDFLTTWIWNYETIFSLTKYLENNTPDFIINIWVCWYKEKKEDLIQISRIYNLSLKKEILPPIFFTFSIPKSIASSEKIVYKWTKLWDENFVDMESYAIELISQKYQIPRIILKVPIDKIWEETKNFDYKKALELLQKNINYKELVEKIQKYLSENKQNSSIENYSSKFPFTFSEKIIFQKLYFKYKSLTQKNFKTFYEKNKDLNKKQFLTKLEKHLENFIIK